MTAVPHPSATGAASGVADRATSGVRHPSFLGIEPNTLLTWVMVALAGSWAGYYLFTPMPQLTLRVFPATLTLHLVTAGAVIVFVTYLAIARRLPGGTPLDIPVIGLIGAYALATYASVSWRASLESTLQFGIAVIVFYVLSGLPFLNARALWRSLMLVGLALALYQLWIVGNDYADYLRIARNVEGLSTDNIVPTTVPRARDVSDHPNILAMLLTLIAPFFTLAAYRGALWERSLGCAGLLAAGWAIFLTLSRGGWAGVAAGGILTIAGALITVRAYERERAGERLTLAAFIPSGFSPTALAAVVGALGLAVFGTLAFMASASTRPGWLFRPSLSARQDAWQAGRDIFSDHLLTGAGPNTFGLLYPSYTSHAAQFVLHAQHAHNGFLQAADDLGLVGIAALVAIGVAAAFMLWRTWRAGTLEQRLLAIACGAALIGFSIHNQVDAGNIWKAPGVALAFVGAIIARNYLELPADARVLPLGGLSADVRRYAGWAVRGSLLVLAIVPLAAWYKIDPPHRDYWRAVDGLNTGSSDIGTSIARLQDAVNADSSMPVYQLQLGVAQASAYDGGGRTDRALLDAAIIHLERAKALDPYSDLPRANLARAYAWAGDDEKAAAEAQLVRLATYHVAPVLVAGEVYEDLGRDIDAISTYGQVLSMDAGLANSTFWQNTPWRQQHFPEILQASTVGFNPCTLGAFIVEGRRYNAGSSIGGLDEALAGCEGVAFLGGANDLLVRVNLARMLMEHGDMAAAFGHLDYAVNRQPDFGPARTELGLWYQREGNIDGARHQWVVGSDLGEPESVRLLGNTYPAGQVPVEIRDRLASLTSTTGSSIQNDLVSVLYFRLRYARPSPVLALIPGDWRAAVPLPVLAQRADLARWQAEAGR